MTERFAECVQGLRLSARPTHLWLWFGGRAVQRHLKFWQSEIAGLGEIKKPTRLGAVLDSLETLCGNTRFQLDVPASQRTGQWRNAAASGVVKRNPTSNPLLHRVFLLRFLLFYSFLPPFIADCGHFDRGYRDRFYCKTANNFLGLEFQLGWFSYRILKMYYRELFFDESIQSVN